MLSQACFLQSSRLSYAVAQALGCAALLLPASALAQAPGALSPGVQLQQQLRQFENSPNPSSGDVDFAPSQENSTPADEQGPQQTMSSKAFVSKGISGTAPMN